MIPKKPILLLDVDGVLNVVGPDWESRVVRLRNHVPGLHPTRYVLPFLRWAWPRFEVMWLTAWGSDANRIAEWAGLKPARVLADPSHATDDYKLKAVRGHFGSTTPSVPVFWIEDGIGVEEMEFVSERPWMFYLATEPMEGVTPAHAKILAALSGVAVPARPRVRAAR